MNETGGCVHSNPCLPSSSMVLLPEILVGQDEALPKLVPQLPECGFVGSVPHEVYDWVEDAIQVDQQVPQHLEKIPRLRWEVQGVLREVGVDDIVADEEVVDGVGDAEDQDDDKDSAGDCSLLFHFLSAHSSIPVPFCLLQLKS